MGTEYTRVGFIGLGAMGKHMVEQLALKLPSEAQIYVYDVVDAAIDGIVTRYPGRMVHATSPKNVVENSVRAIVHPTLLLSETKIRS